MTASDTSPSTILKSYQAYVPLALRTEPKFEALCAWWGHDTSSFVQGSYNKTCDNGVFGRLDLGKVQAFVRLQHATIGLASEGDELDRAVTEDNMLEEGGDIGWYTAQAFAALECLMMGGEFLRVLRSELEIVAENMNALGTLKACVFAFVQDAKKLAFYQNDKKIAALVRHVAGILTALNNLATSSTQVDDLEHLLENNIVKLQKRYPDGYSDWHAKERADKDKETDDAQ